MCVSRSYLIFKRVFSIHYHGARAGVTEMKSSLFPPRLNGVAVGEALAARQVMRGTVAKGCSVC